MKQRKVLALNKQVFSNKCKNPFEYDSCDPYEIALYKGKYLIECFGGSSATISDRSLIGYGAYTSGILSISSFTVLYGYVGGQGSFSNKNSINGSFGGYNGGGNGGHGKIVSNGINYSSGYGGGGATDIRTLKGKWNDMDSLKSRIMVAGGGGGCNAFKNEKGGSAGTLEGDSGYDFNGNEFKGGSQSNGYKLGEGQSGLSKDTHYDNGAEGNSGSGGGYYGGTASQKYGVKSVSTGSGGSSFISGYEGLDIIDNLKFTLAYMKGGERTKHIGPGSLIITRIAAYTSFCKTRTKLFISSIISFVS